MLLINILSKTDPLKLALYLIQKDLGYEQSETSTFLKKLRDANHVKSYREGKRIFYSVDKDNIKNTFEGYVREFN